MKPARELVGTDGYWIHGEYFRARPSSVHWHKGNPDSGMVSFIFDLGNGVVAVMYVPEEKKLEVELV